MPEKFSIRKCKSFLFKDSEEVFSLKYILNNKTEGEGGGSNGSGQCWIGFPSPCRSELVGVLEVRPKKLPLSHCPLYLFLFHYEMVHNEDHTPLKATSYSSNFQVLIFK